MKSDLVTSVTESELAYIASLNYGLEAQQHLAALRKVVFEQDGQFQEGQRWLPYEVVELGAHALATGHEREFAICTLLVVAAVRSGFDSATSLSTKFGEQAESYDALPPVLRKEILNVYESAEC
jgi:hypothetical protein